jgi:hypothetical protein
LIALATSAWRDSPALMAHPALQLGDDRLDALLPQCEPLLGRHAIDVALDGEDRIHAVHRLDRQRRLAQIDKHEEFAPGVTTQEAASVVGPGGRLPW